MNDEFFQYAKNKSPGRCPVKGCRNQSGKVRGKLCHKHYQQRWRARNPVRSYYNQLKTRAKARGHRFTLPYEYFLGFCHGTQFLERHEDKVLTIDRIDATKGYEPGNIQALETSLNTIKGNRERWLSPEKQEAMARARRECAAEWCAGEDEIWDEEDDPF